MKHINTFVLRILPILLFFPANLNCEAKKYQIKCLNTPIITINKQPLKVGDWFNDDAVINWTKDTQAMRVLGEDNKVYTISAKRYKKEKCTKFSDFIACTKSFASRGTHTLKQDLQDIFENEFEIIDEIHIDLSEIKDLPDATIFLILSNDDSIPPLSLKPENGLLIITREDIENITELNTQTPMTVKFVLPNSEDETIITQYFEIILLSLVE